MKIIKKDMKHGIITLKIQSLDDLWHTQKILAPGDLLRARTLRKAQIKRGGEIVKGERKPLTLTIQLEKVAFTETGRLRAGGKITSGPEDVELGAHHTIQIEPGMLITVKKKAWKPWELDRIRKATVKEPLLLVCLIDRDGADFAGLLASGIRFMGSKRFRKQLRKAEGGEERREPFYREIMDTLSRETEYQVIILAGPGFEAENLLKFIKEKEPKLAERIVLEKASERGRSGVQEVVKRSANRVLLQTRVSGETRIVEELLEAIAKDGLAVYGKKETKEAAEMGAIETLLVSEQVVSEFEGMMETVEKQRGKVMIISTTHEAGEKFLNLGGIGGLLRFRVK